MTKSFQEYLDMVSDIGQAMYSAHVRTLAKLDEDLALLIIDERYPRLNEPNLYEHRALVIQDALAFSRKIKASEAKKVK